MIDSLIKWSLHNRLFVILGAALLLVWGGYEALRMPVDVFPDLTAPTVTVLTEAHGMAPEEVETLITFPIETALNGAANVRRVRSSTGVGISVVWVEFEWGMDIYLARQIVSEKLQLAQSSLPPDVPPPVMAPISSIMGEIMFIALTSDLHSSLELKTTADWQIRRRLLAVPGVSQIIPIGGDTKQFQIIVDPNHLARYGIGLDEVVHAVAEANENTSAGFYHHGGQEYLIHGLGRVREVSELENAEIALIDGEPILIKHVAKVMIGPALKRGEGALNGQKAVIIGIQKQPGTNTVALTKRLDTVLDGIQNSLPEGMTIHQRIFRQSDFIEVAIANVFEALRDGALLVVLIVLVFLASFRATAITVLAIPVSLLVAVIVMKFLGATINTMTLGGMAIAIGALVDDAIIDVENVTRRLRENAASAHPKPLLLVVFEASKEIRGAIVFATLIIVLVFLPLFFLSGVEGRLLRPLGLAYIISLAASLITALTLTPVLCALLMAKARSVRKPSEAALVRLLKRGYRPLLLATIERWKGISLLASLLLIGAILLFANLGQSFLPGFNEGTLTISAVTLPGTSLEESNKIGRLVEEIILEQPEVVSTARRTGRAELDEHAQGVNASEIDVNLRMGARSKSAFLEDLRQALTIVPGTNITIGQPISHRIDHMLSGTRANIAVKIFGDNLYRLRQIAEQVRGTMSGIEGIVDLSVEQQVDIPFLTIQFKRDKIARYGMSVKALAETIETAFVGTKVSRILEGQAAFDLVVRMAPELTSDLDLIRATLIATPSGAHVPLKTLADIRKDQGPNTISRENVQRKIVVMCNVAGRDLGHVVGDIQSRMTETVSLPPGYHVAFGGQFESAKAASKRLFLLSLVVLAGIFLLLFMAFGSSGDAFLVMVNLPLALIGGVLGVWATGNVVSVASIIGFITLFGIATRNGILLVSQIHQLMADSDTSDFKATIIQASMERLSPILMTAISAGLALVPLVMKAGQPGGEIEAPMAMVILCGLTSSTLLNIVVVPALYLRFGYWRKPRTKKDGSDFTPTAQIAISQ